MGGVCPLGTGFLGQRRRIAAIEAVTTVWNPKNEDTHGSATSGRAHEFFKFHRLLPCHVLSWTSPDRQARPLWLNAGSGALLVLRDRTSTG